MKNKSRLFVRFFKSLKFHLILLVLVLVLVPGFILSRVIIGNYKTNAVSLRESEISAQVLGFANQIGASEYLLNDQIGPETLEAQISMLSKLYDGRVMVINDVFRIVYDSYNLDTRRTIVSEEVLRSFNGESVVLYDDENRYVELTVPIVNPNEENAKIQGVILISASTDSVSFISSILDETAAITDVILVVVFGFVAIILCIIMVRPLRKISSGIEHIQTGYAGEHLEVSTFSETEDISDRFNELLARIKVIDDSREEFVSNVSHELKTPLTSMKVLADSINSMPDAPLEMYQEFMGDITNEIDRETKIINDLLSLVRMDKSSADLNITNININELVEQILKRLQPIADKQHVSLLLESFRPIMADVDEVKITLAFTNLIENAIKYNRNDGEGYVHVTLNSDHQYLYFKVEDSGMGIPAESLDHIYERFYRVDKSHSREIGGTGLGLAITRSAILMHRGAIKAYSVVGEGTTFDVRIPLHYMV